MTPEPSCVLVRRTVCYALAYQKEIAALTRRVREAEETSDSLVKVNDEYMAHHETLVRRVREVEERNERLQQTLALYESPHVTMTVSYASELEEAANELLLVKEENTCLRAVVKKIEQLTDAPTGGLWRVITEVHQAAAAILTPEKETE